MSGVDNEDIVEFGPDDPEEGLQALSRLSGISLEDVKAMRISNSSETQANGALDSDREGTAEELKAFT